MNEGVVQTEKRSSRRRLVCEHLSDDSLVNEVATELGYLVGEDRVEMGALRSISGSVVQIPCGRGRATLGRVLQVEPRTFSDLVEDTITVLVLATSIGVHA